MSSMTETETESAAETVDGWRRLHPVTPVLNALQLLYAVIIGVFAASVGRNVAVALIAGSVVLVAAWITLAYLRFRYWVTDEGIVITHGVLFRQRRRVR